MEKETLECLGENFVGSYFSVSSICLCVYRDVDSVSSRWQHLFYGLKIGIYVV